MKAFEDCSRLADVYVNWAIPPDIPENVFEGVNVASCTLHVPAGREALYKAAGVWKKFPVSGLRNSGRR
jgi:hypothetical protein